MTNDRIVTNEEEPREERKSDRTTGNPLIILAGATGDLGQRIADYLLKSGATVRALVRPGSDPRKLDALRQQGVAVVAVDFSDAAALTQACTGGFCLVSALSGLRDVIVELQTKLLRAAVEAGVPRFIPSDYCIDFTKLAPGSNRNLDLRREFQERLDRAPIAATSILNGMFTDLLNGQAPVVLFGLKRVLYWGDADQPMDFTTIDNTAAFTAAAALDPDTPRFLRIAGEVATVRDLRKAASAATGNEFGLFRMGGLGVLDFMINVTRTLFPQNQEVFPPWQGMQYLRNMLSGQPKLDPLDNDRYPHIRWTSVQEVLKNRSS
ncbi:NmrA family NAD(P)-binding protein [Larkinella insperata]|uniref:NmrA family NAD(P)-binding protein n=1 Tax=Larkinella insperata TaxID=332158 RepID=A0ABW3Q8Q9_9BACT|nr:NmrA family NAD(P)-binding protein [Larkinella insperata]